MYLAESRYREPKEIFKLVAARLREAGLPPGARVADLGCAAGELLHLLRRELPDAELLGFDVVPELLEKARHEVPGAAFAQASVLDPDALPGATLDAALMLGVHSIFDDVEPWLGNLVRWTRPGGLILVFGLFNPHPVDVWIRYRDVERHGPEHRERGWNNLSQRTVGDAVERLLGPGRHAFTPFSLPFDLAPNPDDPIRSWTEPLAGGGRTFANGLGLHGDLHLLEIRR